MSLSCTHSCTLSFSSLTITHTCKHARTHAQKLQSRQYGQADKEMIKEKGTERGEREK